MKPIKSKVVKKKVTKKVDIKEAILEQKRLTCVNCEFTHTVTVLSSADTSNYICPKCSIGEDLPDGED